MPIKLSTALALMILSSGITAWLLNTPDSREESQTKPLYWVAPMDPSYRRDEPGKSPMGMDLIPVYAESGENKAGPTVTPSMQQNLGIKTETAERKILHRRVSALGKVDFDRSAQWTESAHVDAWIESMSVTDAGQNVRRGDPIYTVYSHELITAQENLILALNKSNQALLDAARQRLLQFSIAPATIKQIEKDQRVQERLPVLAAQSGLVDEVRVRPGEFVRVGQSLFTLQDPSKRWATIEIAPGDTDILKSDFAVSINSLNRPEIRLDARVLDHIPSVDPRSRKHRIRIAIESSTVTLRADELVRAELIAKTPVEALVIPRSALVNDGSQNFVAVLHDQGEYEFRVIETGIEDSNYIEVRAGINEGERVVVNGQFLLDSTASLTPSSDSTTEPTQAESVWVKAHIISSTPDFGMVEVHHEAIKEWAWPPMKMEFEVLDSTLWPKLKQGSQVEIKITQTQYGSGIMEVRSAGRDQGMPPIKQTDQPMDHGQHHNHGGPTDKPTEHSLHNDEVQTNKSTEHAPHNHEEQADKPTEHAHHNHGGRP